MRRERHEKQQKKIIFVAWIAIWERSRTLGKIAFNLVSALRWNLKQHMFSRFHSCRSSFSMFDFDSSSCPCSVLLRFLYRLYTLHNMIVECIALSSSLLRLFSILFFRSFFVYIFRFPTFYIMRLKRSERWFTRCDVKQRNGRARD